MDNIIDLVRNNLLTVGFVVIVVYLLYRLNVVETMADTSASAIREQVKDVYQVDVVAIKNLGDLANQILTADGKLVLPYDVEIQGNLDIDSSFTAKKGDIRLTTAGGKTFFQSRHNDIIFSDINQSSAGNKNLQTAGTGVFGEAKIGTSGKFGKGYAELSHKSHFGTNKYTLGMNGSGAWLNGNDGVYIRARGMEKLDLPHHSTGKLTTFHHGNVKINNSLEVNKNIKSNERIYMGGNPVIGHKDNIALVNKSSNRKGILHAADANNNVVWSGVTAPRNDYDKWIINKV